jgi:hypothetical protein
VQTRHASEIGVGTWLARPAAPVPEPENRDRSLLNPLETTT